MNAGSFSAAMIQMRSSLTPGANIDDAVRMIGEAKAAGADGMVGGQMLDLLAEPPDVNGDGAGVECRRVAPDSPHQVVAREDATRMACEE